MRKIQFLTKIWPFSKVNRTRISFCFLVLSGLLSLVLFSFSFSNLGSINNRFDYPNEEKLLLAPCTNGNLGGTVFNDFNGNGTNDTEPGVEGIAVDIYGIDGNGAEVHIESVSTDINGEYVFTDPSITFLSNEAYRIEFSGWPEYYSPSLKGSSNNGSTIIVTTLSCNNDFGLVESDSYCQPNPYLITSCYVEGDQGVTSGDVLISWEYNVIPEASENNDITNILHESLSGQIGTTFGLAYHKRSNNVFAAAHMKRFAGFAPGTDPATIFIIDNPSDNNTSGTDFLSLEEYFGSNVAGSDIHDFSLVDVNPSPLITQNEVLDAQAFDAVGKYALGDIEFNTNQDTLYVVNLFDRNIYSIPVGPDPENPVKPANASEINIVSLTGSNVFNQITSTVGMDELRPFALKYYRQKLYVGMVGSGQSGGDLSAMVFEYDPMDGSLIKVLESSLVYARGCAFGINNGGAFNICAGLADWNPWISSWPQNTGGGPQDAAAVNINFISPTTILALEEGHPQPMLTDIEFDAEGNMILALRDRVGDQCGTNAPYPGGEQVRLPNGNYIFTNNAGGYSNSPNPTPPPGFINLYVTNQDAFGDLLRATKSGSSYTVNISDFTDNTATLPNSQMTFDNCVPGETVFNGDCYNDGLFVHEETSMGGLAVLLHQNTLVAPAMDPRANAFSNGVDWFDLGGLTNKTKSITVLTGANSPFGKAYGLGEMELQCSLPPIQLGDYVWSDANGDGIQNPNENGIADVTVNLYDAGKNAIGNTMTDSEGYYLFDNSNTSQDLEPEEVYFISFGEGQYDLGSGILTINGNELYEMTMDSIGTGSQPNNNDSDIESMATMFGGAPFSSLTSPEYGADHRIDAGFIPKPDLALIQVLDPDYDITGLSFGDSVKFKITVFNQSVASIDSLEITDYVPDGFTFDAAIIGNEQWSPNGDNAVAVLSGGLVSGAKDSICIYLILEQSEDPLNWINVAEISNAWYNGEIIQDCDSQLNNDPNDNGGSEINTGADNEVNGDGTATEPGGDSLTDQDNVDPATIAICDLALINTIVESPVNLQLGDTIKYAIIIENQGTVPSNNIEIDYSIPMGLTYLDMNNGLMPQWNEGSGDASALIPDILNIGEKDTICIYLAVANVSTAQVSTESWTTFAEISSFETPGNPGVDKSDVDSTPDGDPTNDSGGNPDDMTDNETGGTGQGDPTNPLEDMDPALDEDDHDPAKIEICDAATIIYTDDTDPILYGDTIKFNVVVYNQGNDTITNLLVNNSLGEGLEYISTPENIAEGWTGDNDQVSVIFDALLAPGESDTLCLQLEVVSTMTYDVSDYVQIVEIESFADSDDPGTPKGDIDSTPDTDPTNDSGGNTNDATDNAIDGNGSGDPNNPSEDMDPALDEDDHDPVEVSVFDLALDKKLMGSQTTYSPGESPVFEITVYNQGNVAATSFTITDSLRNGFMFNMGDNLSWSLAGANKIEYTHSTSLEPGDEVTIPLVLEVVIPMMPMGQSDWWNYAEISVIDDNGNTGDTPPTDADSNPNDNVLDDNQVEPGDAEDDVINENSFEGGDEDDHDVSAVIVGYDLALDKVVSPMGPYAYGDTLTYTINVYNQGGLTVTNIDVYDSIPCGLTYIVENDTEWALTGSIATATIAGPIASGGMVPIEMKLVIGQCGTPAYDNYYNQAEISGFRDEDGNVPTTNDIDSTPDDEIGNDGTPVDNEINENGNAGGDEDDHDFEDIEICDVALINRITEIPSIVSPGDTVKYEVIIFNQGNNDVNSTTIAYSIPNGLTYLPLNSSLAPNWMSESNGEARITTANVIAPSESDTVCIYLELEHLSTNDATEESWTTIAEIMEYTDENDGIKTLDADSTPDGDPTNDPGGNPDDATNDVVTGDGTGDPTDPIENMDPTLDEDDHDPEIIEVCDAAAILNTEETGPFSYGDTLKYFVELHNQGNGDITNINLRNLYGVGLNYLPTTENIAAGWIMNGGGELSLLYTDTIAPGEVDTICLYMEIVPDYTSSEESWLQNLEIVSYEDPDNPGTPKADFDSTPDDDPMNDPGGNPNDDATDDVTDGDGSGDPTDPNENTDPALDEDDQDMEDIEICDVALINTIVEVNNPAQVGDTVKYEVIIINQGNTIINGASIDYNISNGLVYLSENNGLTPAWTAVGTSLAQVSTTEVLHPGERDTLCIYLEMINLPTGGATADSWTTTAEITSTLDEDGQPKTEDVDSTPDNDPMNDPGGNPDDATNDVVTGDGTGDSTDPIEDMDPTLDEDDHDREIIEVCDAAAILNTEETGPFSYGDTLKYFVELHNQGNGDITNINLRNLYGVGLNYLSTTENIAAGWIMNGGGELSLLYTDTIAPGEVDTICLYMEIVPDYTSSEESWLQNLEIVSYEDPDNPGVPKADFDSTPDDDPMNDPGGNPNDDATDDVTDGDGSGDPSDPIEDTDPTLDEDDQDVEDIEICDMALINVLVEVNALAQLGDTVKYEVIILNQGNTITNGVSIDYNIPNGLVYLPDNNGLTPAWTAVGTSLAQVSTTEVLHPGERDTLCIYLEMINLPTGEATADSWTTIAEITSTLDEDGQPKTEDVDSTPDNDPMNDPGGNPDDATNDVVTGDGTGDPTDPIEDMDPTLDEDDHDPEIIEVCDAAAILNTEETGPFSYGDTLKYFVELHNQGNGDITNINLRNLYGVGLNYLSTTENIAAGWIMNGGGELSLLYTDTIAPGEVDTICLYMEIVPDYTSSEESWLQNLEIVSYEDPDNPGVPKADFDSTPDDDPMNDPGGNPNDDATDDVTDGDGSGDPTDPNENTDPALDEDDQDVEDIEICDVALINTIVEVNDPAQVGDTVKYEVIIINQGNTIINGVSIDYNIPNGLVYLSENNGLIPAWTSVGTSLAQVSTTEILLPGERDTLCIYLEMINLPTGDVTSDSWTTTAEITSTLDEDGQPKTEDVDSTPDNDPTNDPGGNPDDATNDVVTGDGTGDPTDPIENMDPTLDEDDHDPEIIEVCDAAAILNTEETGPFSYGDTLKYFVELHNQGNGDITNINLRNLYGVGLNYLSTTENIAAGWIMNGGGELSLLYTDTIAPGEVDTICLYMEIVPDYTSSEESWLQNLEIVSYEDPDNPGVPKADFDSTPDDDPMNDPGGNPNDDATDDVTDGDGSGDPSDPIEDTDPTLDEDDQDVEDIEICDMALINVLVEVNALAQLGDTVKYEVIILNQGNTITNGVSIDYNIPNGLVYLPDNNGLTPAWTAVGTSLAQVSTTEVLHPGERDTLCIYLEMINLPTGGATADSWTTTAEITSTLDEDGQPKTEDVDSTPDNDPTNDPGGNPDDATNDVVTGDGTGDPTDPIENMDPTLDEDDHDPEIIEVCDAAAILNTEETGPFSYGDTLKYFVELHNQGNGDITNINLRNLYGVGLNYLSTTENIAAGWIMNGGGELSLLYTDTIAPGEVDTICLYMEIVPDYTSSEESWLQNLEIVSYEDPDNPGTPKADFDSTPDDDPMNDPGGNPNDDATDDVTDGDGSGDPTDPNENTDPALDEDDQDVEDIEICDVALINTIVEVNDPARVGDTVKYEVIIINQGNTIINGVSIDYNIPNGLVYLSENNGLIPAWTSVGTSLAQVSTTEILLPGERDTLCIYLEMINLPTGDVTSDSWTTTAEITSTLDEDGQPKTEDVDSTPDNDPTNDPGGNPDDATNDVVTGDGTGDPTDPIENMDPTLDEDDHDPEIIEVCDAAAILNTEETGPFSYGDTLKYFVELHNQGNGDITNINLRNLYGVGLNYLSTTENIAAGWIMNGGGELSLLYTDTIAPGEVDTICLYMEIVPDYTSSEESWLQNLEIVSYEDPDNPGVPKADFDSTPDDDPMNDPGGNPNDDATDDVTDGDGSGDPSDPIEDTDPTLDEDDQDVEDIEICDVALINTIVELEEPPSIGDTVKYEVIVVNQGNVGVNSVDIDYDVPNGLIFLPVNEGLDPSWTEESMTLLSSTTAALAPGESDTLCLYLQLENVPTAEVTGDSWTTVAEITGYVDEDGEAKTTDVDSSPDSDPDNDSGGNPGDDTDDELEGNGTGDPTDFVEDMDPTLDEDDHDPAIVYIHDVATVFRSNIPTDINYFDVLEYSVVVSNQGNCDLTNIVLVDHLPEGFELIPTSINTEEGWEESDTIEDAIFVVYEEILPSGESDTIHLELEILPVHQDSDEESWLQIVEAAQIEDPNNPGEAMSDFDSTSDTDPDNDSGGNPNDDTDDETNGDGSGDPNDPDEDSDPTLDEDDHDAVDTKVFDLALIMQIDSMPPVLPVVPGDILKFIIEITNQGNTPANSVEITNYLMDGNLELAPIKENDDWNLIDSETNKYTIDGVLVPGEKDTVCIYLEVIGGAMTDIITYSEISGATETDGDCYDIDSTPDDELEGDAGGTPETDEDDHIEDDGEDGNEDSITDEDDHDPAKLDGQDLALIIWADQKEPVLEGQDVKFIIRISNQGNITNENIKIVDYLPEGFELSENDDNGWEYDESNDSQVTKTLTEPLESDEVVETCILLTVQEGTSASDLINYAEIVSSIGTNGLDLTNLDIDSYPNNVDDDDTGGQYEDMPDCSTDPIVINDDNNIEGAGVNNEDEDDHDPAWVHVFDLATIIYTDRTTPIIPGDEIKFNVEIHNQGNMSATDIDLLIYLPEGFTLSENDTNDWSLNGELLTTIYSGSLVPESVDTVCLLLEVLPDFTLFDLIPIVEITGAMDTLGNERNDFDLDSEPNESAEDDEGGEIFTDDDDSVVGNGEVNDDEDDHDPGVPPVMDLALKVITVDESPKMPGDIVKFSIMVYNQGSMTPSEFTIENYVPEGLIFLNNSDNNGWLPSGATNATYVYEDELLPLTSDTLCIYLEVAPDANPMNVVDMVEIIQIIDQMDADVSLLDIDSESDNSNENDLGNDLYSLEDNKIDENGRSGFDEDDHDQAFVNMCQGISCNSHMNISVDENCEAEITPSVVLTGDIFPDHVYDLMITSSNGEEVSNMFGGDDIGQLFTVTVTNPLCNNNSCWMTILIEDKWAPQIICANDTLSCAMAFDESNEPTLIDDNCSGGELILVDEIIETFTCDSLFTSRLTRVWTATDAAGNMADTCTQIISLLRTNLDSIVPVINFMLATNNAISCSSGFATDSNGHPAPSVTGVPRLRIEDGSFIDLYPFDAATICNGFVVYEDEILQGSTGCVTKILRTWTVGEWWCSQTIEREFIQLIEVVDFEGPSVICPADVTISTASFSCEGYISLNLPMVSDACNGDNIRIDLSAPTSPAGFIKDYTGSAIVLPVGINELTYHVYDDCDNRTDCTFRVVVQDESDPIAICDQFTSIGIGLEELTKVSAESIDDGSFDECGAVHLSVARMDAPGFEDLIDFGSEVDITCADVGSNVMVGLLVTDAGGNTNMCMVSIEVQDKVDAQFLCPDDMEVECNFPYDPSNLSAFFGEVTIYDNCPSGNSVEDTLVGNLNSCGAGVLIREIRLLNAQGEQVDFCTQQITFENGTTLQYSDITPPISEVTVTGCGVESIDPSILGMPIVPDNECQLTGIGIENDTFPFTENGACLKIIRTFKVVDWCMDEGPGSVLEPFEFIQTIKVNNTESPEIEVFSDSVFCSFEVDCGGININGYLIATASDDCTASDDLLNRYEVKDSDGEVVNFGVGLDASGLYGVDTYTVRFISEDKCGNQVFEESTFEVRSCKLPTPYCLQGLSTTLTAMDTTGDGTPDVEMVVLSADFFDAGSYHPCEYDVQVSFSSDVNDTLKSFFCSDTIGLQLIELWATDENGGQDYCATFVDVQDNDTIDLCGGLKLVDIAGRIYTESDVELREAEVELRSTERITTMTDKNGIFEFENMPEGRNYKVIPRKDNDHLNGVSTLDLVLIQRHILQITPLSTVYGLIAADINNNKKISSSDLLALRKVILGIDAGFPDNTSWRFIDVEHEFGNENNPWETQIKESHEIMELSEDIQVDFIAVKTGDVNGDVSMNIAAGVVGEVRSNSTLTLELPDISVQRDNLYEVEVRGREEVNVFGMQYSLAMDGLELVDILPGRMNLRREHTSERKGQLHVSYTSARGDAISHDDELYTVVLKATKDGRLSEMIGLSNKGLVAESYHGEGLAVGDVDIAWRETGEASLIELLNLKGNSPNPWRNSTDIVFQLPRKGSVSLIVSDINGRLLMNKVGEFETGVQRMKLTDRELPQVGVLLYELQFENQIEKGKMIRIE